MATDRRQDRTSAAAVWLAGASLVIYFLSSYSVREYLRFLGENIGQALEILSR